MAVRKHLPEQFLQLFARGVLAAVFFLLGRPIPPRKFKVLTEISHVLFKDRVRPAVPTLMRRPRIMADTVQANPQVRGAMVAALAPPGLAREGPLPTTFMTMSRHALTLI
jgi:hypothetical protein